MASTRPSAAERFDPAAYETFRFTGRSLAADGTVTLDYALDDGPVFREELRLPLDGPLSDSARHDLDGLVSLLHWVAGVSYYKAAAPPAVSLETDAPEAATARLLEALYSEGLGEFALANELRALPCPRFGERGAASGAMRPPARGEPERVLVPVGGGKDSIVALEAVRASGVETALFSVGDAPPIARTAQVSGLPRLVAHRRLDPVLLELNARGALNGHVPVTAIVSCVALLTAAARGYDAVAMANERSASAGNVVWRGVEINHQFSKSVRAEALMRAALADISGAPDLFSVLRPASELAIARAFAGLERYHAAFTSCNATFRLDESRRRESWCCECPKCRFVYLAMAPFCGPAQMRAIFGRDLLAEPEQFEGFALLTATGGHKPFECVGEEEESIAAIRLLVADERWRDHAVVARLADEVLPAHPLPAGDPVLVLTLTDEHFVPSRLLNEVRALLGS
jgi:hypothetical protein